MLNRSLTYEAKKQFLHEALSYLALLGTRLDLDLSSQFEDAQDEEEKNTVYCASSLLLLFRKVIHEAIYNLENSTGLLPAIAPIFAISTGNIKLHPELLVYFQNNFLAWLRLNKTIEKLFKSTLHEKLYKEHTTASDHFSTSAFIHSHLNSAIKGLEAFNHLLLNNFLNNNANVKSLLFEEVRRLGKQICNSAINWAHAPSTGFPASMLHTFFTTINSKGIIPKKYKISPAIPWRQAQVGQTCKLHAFYSATWIIHLLTPDITPCPPPVHRNEHLPAEKHSLREQAQKLFASLLGETYSPAYIMQLAKANNFNNVWSLYPSTEQYIIQLKQIIDRNYLGLVYFDVNLDDKHSNRGLPIQEEGNYEHSAVVFGYVTDQDNNDYFYLYQWTGYYLFPAIELLNSTKQLTRRQGEMFYDLSTEGEANWCELKASQKFYPDNMEKINQKQYRQNLFSPPPAKNLPTFQNCIIAVGSNSPTPLKRRDPVS